MTVIGITGGSGCGKTTLLKRIEALGGLCIDCDALYHRLLAEDGAMIGAILQRFPGVGAAGVLTARSWEPSSLPTPRPYRI